MCQNCNVQTSNFNIIIIIKDSYKMKSMNNNLVMLSRCTVCNKKNLK